MLAKSHLPSSDVGLQAVCIDDIRSSEVVSVPENTKSTLGKPDRHHG